LNEILDRFRSGQSNLLLGTQLLVKGHDFPNVTLVVVVLADSLFRWPDFRAPERAFQILKQVSGRAGRGEKSGNVLIQAFDAEHPVLQVVSGRQSEESFFETERELRMALHYPPFGRIARLRVEGLDQAQVSRAALSLGDLLRSEFPLGSGLDVLGPSEAFLEKSNGIFRWDLLLKAREIQVLQKALRYSKRVSKAGKQRTQIDVDPYGV
jgi:primosomal protein N' (replication factor Y)